MTLSVCKTVIGIQKNARHLAAADVNQTIDAMGGAKLEDKATEGFDLRAFGQLDACDAYARARRRHPIALLQREALRLALKRAERVAARRFCRRVWRLKFFHPLETKILELKTNAFALTLDGTTS